jgi:glycosyltransferase involved in cell wall biosynthesis
VVFVAPFASRPKGTVPVRMQPLARRLALGGHSVSIVLPPYDNPAESRRETVDGSVRLYNVYVPPRQGLVSYLFVTLLLVARVLTLKPEVVHIFKPKGYSGMVALVLFALRRCRVIHVPVIVDTDDLEGRGGFTDLFRQNSTYSSIVLRFLELQEQWISKYADYMTVASRTLAEHSARLGTPKDRILYIPNGPPDDWASPPNASTHDLRRQLGLEGRTSILLYTRFFEYDILQLVRNLYRLRILIPTFGLIVVGRGPSGEERTFLNLVNRFGLKDNVIYVGWVERDRIPAYVKSCDFALYPFDDNPLNRAKCPGKLVELMSAGVAIVAESVGQIAEYIEDGSSGLLVGPGESAAFVDCAFRLARGRSLRQRLGRGAFKRIVKDFNWDKATKELERVYLQLQTDGL